MSEYAFVTRWRLDAPIDRVWDAIHAVEEWPQWWPYVQSVTLLRSGDAIGVGAVRRYVWTSRLPYKLAFDMETMLVERPTRLEGVARGELDGQGVWTLTPDGSATRVRYDWKVRTSKRWMNLVAPIARPFFNWNHDSVMRAGGEGLARWLKTDLVSASRP